LRVLRRLFLFAILLYAVELLLNRHWFAAPLAMLASSAFGHRRAFAIATGGSADCLVVAPDGRLFLKSRAGGIEEVWLRPASLRLGPHLLLVLRSSGPDVRLLLGPDNLPAPLLAALNRRLLAGTVASGTALHWVTASGSKTQPP
jgi:hypothetical protein